MTNSELDYIKKNPTWVSRRQAAKLTTFGVRTIDRYIREGRIYAVKRGAQRVLIAKETLRIEFLNAPKPLFN